MFILAYIPQSWFVFAHRRSQQLYLAILIRPFYTLKWTGYTWRYVDLVHALHLRRRNKIISCRISSPPGLLRIHFQTRARSTTDAIFSWPSAAPWAEGKLQKTLKNLTYSSWRVIKWMNFSSASIKRVEFHTRKNYGRMLIYPYFAYSFRNRKRKILPVCKSFETILDCHWNRNEGVTHWLLVWLMLIQISQHLPFLLR